MKPTQEQVIAWAREAKAGMLHGGEYSLMGNAAIERFASLAHEAGRNDENEACAKMCGDMVLYTGFDCAAAIRARREK